MALAWFKLQYIFVNGGSLPTSMFVDPGDHIMYLRRHKLTLGIFAVKTGDDTYYPVEPRKKTALLSSMLLV